MEGSGDLAGDDGGQNRGDGKKGKTAHPFI